MNKSVLEEIEREWRLLNEGKEEEAIQLVVQFEKGNDHISEEKHAFQILNGFLIYILSKL
ncbi:MAG: hypothetical protein ACFFDB_10085 [Promethearchaeota archaeon]